MRTLLFDYMLLVVFVLTVIVAALVVLTKSRARYWVSGAVLASCLLVLTEPKAVIPVSGAGVQDWHPESFWYEPWGRRFFTEA